MRILIIDDNPYDAELVRLELKRHEQFQFDHVESYAAFKEYYSIRKYTAILSDYYLPGTSTIDILKEVRLDDKIIPYIFVSGTVGEEQAVELMKMGATDYVLKNNLGKLPLALKRAIKEMETILAEKEAIKELQENEKRFRSILENAPDATLMVDALGDIQFANKQAEKIFGYSANEFLTLKLDHLIPERYRSNHASHLHHYTQKPSMRVMGDGMDLYGLRKDGTEFSADIGLSPVIGKNTTFTVCSIRDITQRKAAEQEILKKKELLRDAQHLAKTGSWEWNLESGDVAWSDEMFNILGLNPNDCKVTFELLFDFVHPDDKESVLSRAKQRKAEPTVLRPAMPVRYRIITRTGELKYVESKARNILDSEGRIITLTGTIQDITEQILAEEEKLKLQEKAMEMLEDKVIERTEELYKMNHVLELRNLEITDSFNYAQHIQRAILSKTEDCQIIFPDCFVFWMPKEIVSGDFYWCYSNELYDFLAVVDCTGHGVPGALMSIIGNQLLDRVVNTYGFMNPKDILHHLNHAVVSALKQETGKVKDGMDIAIFRVDKKNKELVFAGAQRPLFYFDGNHLTEILGSKEGIGGLLSEGERKTFAETTITYKTGDTFYLTSDGYYSQFGGANGKKMMKNRMKAHLSSIAHTPIHEQKNSLYAYYKEWQGEEEQVDDVLVIGVRM